MRKIHISFQKIKRLFAKLGDEAINVLWENQMLQQTKREKSMLILGKGSFR